MSTNYSSDGVGRADTLEVSDHAKNRFAQRFDAKDQFPADTLRQIVASVQRGGASAPPHVENGIAVVVDRFERRIVTVYAIDDDRPRVIRS